MMRPVLSAPLLCLLPALALVPVLIVVGQGLHGGGFEPWWRFLQGAVQPSKDPLLLKSLWDGLQVTLATALVGNGWPWMALAGNGWPWSAFVGNGWTCQHWLAVIAMAGDGGPWPGLGGNGRPWLAMAG